MANKPHFYATQTTKLKMKHLILAALITIFSLTVFSQTDSTVAPKDTSYWKKGGSFNLNFTRVQLKNWAGGGQNSVSLASILKLNANYKKAKHSWKNSLDVSFGMAKVAEKDFRKSDDQLILLSKYGYKIKKNFSFSALVDFRTQMAAGYEYSLGTDGKEVSKEISNFLAPAFILKSVGFEYTKGEFFAVISPLTGKTTIVNDKILSDAGAFGVDPGQTVRFELGSLLKTGYKITLMKNVDFSTTVTLFSAYDHIEHIDVNWETSTQFKINDYLSTTFTTQLLYDDDIAILREDGTTGAATQYKDVLNIGLLYKF